MSLSRYRAWDKENNRMVYTSTNDVYFELTDDGINILDMSVEPFDDVFPHLDAILMQYTGLKDKNGVEIYEGDIVRYTWDMLSDVNATEKGKKVRISKVFWSDWRASWAVGKKSCNNDLFRYARNGNTVEVIGNIYEQPELLS